jgi:predicted MPP superfamily phosphohydrolase
MSAAPLAVTTLAIAGHVVIVRALLARSYELGLPQRIWNALFALHALVGIGGAFVLARVISRAWPSLDLAWAAYVVLCVLALAIGAVILVLRTRATVPGQLAMRADVADSCAALQHVPSGEGRIARVARRLPGNQIFTAEFVQREIRLARLPAALDGLSILHLTDLHMNGTPDRAFFEWACARCADERPDLVAMTGDVIDHLGVVDWLPSTLGRFVERAPHGCYFVLGNHDLHVAGPEIRAAMEELGWTSVAGRVITKDVRGHTLLLAGTERPWAGEDPPLAEAPQGDVRILLSHAPHLVRIARRQHVDLMLAGHLHGGQIRWPLLGPLNGGRFHGGLYDVPPTLLHVGRGLGQMAMAPYRWRCPPEVTTLILRAG